MENNTHFPFDRVRSPQATKPLDLSVVMPVFNEGDIVEAVLTDWSQSLTEMGLNFELVVINDGSLDGTGRVLDKLRRDWTHLRVVHQLNTGHSQAVLRGYGLARGEYILQCDLNGRYEPDDFARLWEAKGVKRLLIAHRTHRLDSLPRRFFASTLKKMTEWVCKVRLEDPNVPFRLFKREPLVPFLKSLPPSWKSVNLALSIFVAQQTPQLVDEIKIPFRKRSLVKSTTSLYELMNLGFEYFGELLSLRKILKQLSKTNSQPFAKVATQVTGQ